LIFRFIKEGIVSWENVNIVAIQQDYFVKNIKSVRQNILKVNSKYIE